MLIKSVPVLIVVLLCTIFVSAQEKCPVKFGHVTAEDFDISKFNVDTTEGGVIIADVGSHFSFLFKTKIKYFAYLPKLPF